MLAFLLLELIPADWRATTLAAGLFMRAFLLLELIPADGRATTLAAGLFSRLCTLVVLMLEVLLDKIEGARFREYRRDTAEGASDAGSDVFDDSVPRIE